MPTSYTPRLNLPEMADGEESGYVTFNELARIMDALFHPTVQDRALTTPPGSPVDGQCWYVPVGATGDWAGQDRKLAQWYNGGWQFYGLPEWFEMYNVAEAARVHIDTNDVVHVSDDPADGHLYAKRDGKWVASTPELAVVYGAPANGTLSTGGLSLTGWPDKGETPEMAGSFNQSTGVFTCPEAGLYSVNLFLIGTQGNSNKEESILLNIIRVGGANDGTHPGSHESVDTDKTSVRSLGVNFITDLAQGEQISAELVATTNLGMFSFENATFSITRII